jgi:capsid protein
MPRKKSANVPKPKAKPSAGEATPKPQASWNNNFLNGGFQFSRRAWYGSTPQDNKRDVREGDRMQLMQRARYAEKNYPSMVQYVNDMVMYVVGDGLKYTSHAEDPAKARLYEEYYYRETRRADVTGKSGEQIQRIIVHTWAVDGEIFSIKVRDPKTGKAKMQLIEGHRVLNPDDQTLLDKNTWDGIVFDELGGVKGYWVQTGESGYRLIPAASMCHVANLQRVSSGHGLPPMQQALNSMQDQVEIIELEKRACKQVTDTPNVLTKNGGAIDDSMAADLNGIGSSTFNQIGQQMGGKLLVLEPGEDLKSVTPNFPRQSMEMFNAVLSRMIAAGGLPYEVVSDGSKAGSALIRMVLGKADRYVSQIQCMVVDEYCVPDWQWRISDGIARGELPEDPRWAEVEFTCPQMPSIDNGRDSKNDREDLLAGLTNYTEIYKKRGQDFQKAFMQLVRDISFAKDVTAATGGKVTYEEAMQRMLGQSGGGVAPVSQPLDGADGPPSGPGEDAPLNL